MKNKGFALWLTTKIAVLMFSASLMGGFFYFLYVQNDYYGMDSLRLQSENIAGAAGSVAQAKYKISALIEVSGLSKINVSRSGGADLLTVHGGARNFTLKLLPETAGVEINNPSKLKISSDGTGRVVITSA
ncbi:MAG: hypothetical protein V1911_02210 [Candidatus Micrarchaeota archaeon]